MKTGDLNRIISIQSKIKTEDSIGSWSETWVEFTETRAAIWPVSAGEQVKNQQIENQVTHRIRMRYQAGIIPEMRIVHKSRIFEIISIINVQEEDRWLDLICTESS